MPVSIPIGTRRAFLYQCLVCSGIVRVIICDAGDVDSIRPSAVWIHRFGKRVRVVRLIGKIYAEKKTFPQDLDRDDGGDFGQPVSLVNTAGVGFAV